MVRIRAGKPLAVGPAVTPGKPAQGRRVVVTAKPLEVTPTDEGTVWFGEGPPWLNLPLGFAVGDSYVDNLTGTVYRLDPGE